MSQMGCFHCHEPFTLDDGEDRGQPISTADGVIHPTHWQCSMRSALGGIGHLTGHSFWCTVMNDPDGGLGYRTSALAVAVYVDVFGIEKAAAVTFETPGE